MNCRRIFFAVLLFGPFVSAKHANAQDQLVIPSPEASGIVKYGNFPVDHSSGLVDIEIPIYTIQSRKLELPIKLNYHASGIRVDDISSVVGLGWVLNAGGVLVKSIKGKDDVMDKLPIVKTMQELAGMSSEAQMFYLQDYEFGYRDSETDFYTYRASGISGSFIAGKEENTYIQIPYSDNKIIKNEDGYTVLSENGTEYIFGDYETTNNRKTGYYLSQIIAADRSDTITFKYDILTEEFDESEENTLLRRGAVECESTAYNDGIKRYFK